MRDAVLPGGNALPKDDPSDAYQVGGRQSSGSYGASAVKNSATFS
jgi:hypothetical protein